MHQTTEISFQISLLVQLITATFSLSLDSFLRKLIQGFVRHDINRSKVLLLQESSGAIAKGEIVEKSEKEERCDFISKCFA